MGAGRKTRPYAVGVAIQAIYAAATVISKASFDQGLSIFVYILYRQVAACLLLLPVAVLLERCLHDFKLFDWHGCSCSCMKSSRSSSCRRRNAPPMSFRLLLKMFFYSLVKYACRDLHDTG
jgi:hypothetical protein